MHHFHHANADMYSRDELNSNKTATLHRRNELK